MAWRVGARRATAECRQVASRNVVDVTASPEWRLRSKNVLFPVMVVSTACFLGAGAYFIVVVSKMTVRRSGRSSGGRGGFCS